MSGSPAACSGRPCRPYRMFVARRCRVSLHCAAAPGPAPRRPHRANSAPGSSSMVGEES